MYSSRFFFFFFFFSSRRRHTRCYRDWSSDVCSSDLGAKRTRNPEVRDSGSAPCGASRNDVEKLHRALERFDEVGLLPGEAALIVRRAAEMAVGRGARVDRPVEVEVLADAARRQVHGFSYGLLEL